MNYPKRFAGVWFGGVGLFTSQIILLTFYRKTNIDLVLDPLPVVASAICGAWLGGAIILTSVDRAASSAVKRGIIVMLLSFLLYCLLVSAFTAILNKSVAYGLGTLFEFTVFGGILFGWFVALMGAMGGWLLYRISKHSS